MQSAIPVCPITQEPFWDPVIDPEGNTYEKSAIVQWLNENNVSPITRLPIGNQVLSSLPSTLDYGAASLGLIGDGALFWKGVPADHAGVVLRCRDVCVTLDARKRRWK